MKKSIVTLSILTFTLLSCKKEGPIGPAGKDGNANVSNLSFFLSGTDFTPQSDPKVFHYKKYIANLTPQDNVSVSFAESTSDFYLSLPFNTSDTEYLFGVKNDTLLLYQYQNTSTNADDLFYSIKITKVN